MSDAPAEHPTTRYFREQVLRKRSYLRLEWCVAIVDNPLRRQTQPGGRVRFWGYVPEISRYLRVVTLEDGRTIHNAFPDRDFDPASKDQP
jgi:hypothetical protein